MSRILPPRPAPRNYFNRRRYSHTRVRTRYLVQDVDAPCRLVRQVKEFGSELSSLGDCCPGRTSRPGSTGSEYFRFPVFLPHVILPRSFVAGIMGTGCHLTGCREECSNVPKSSRDL